MALTHALGFDGVKIDSCGAQKNMTLYASLFNKTGKPIVLENCPQGQVNATACTRLSSLGYFFTPSVAVF